MAGTVVLIHAGDSVRPAYEAVLGGLSLHLVEAGGYSASYDGTKGLAAAHPSVAAYIPTIAPGWKPGDPLVLVGFSAGCWALRSWLEDAANRRVATAVVLLDGLHSAGDALRCDATALAGVIEYARDPDKLCVVTHTEIIPPGYASTTACAAVVEDAAPDAVVLGYPGRTAEAHMNQLRAVGPAVLRDEVLPFLAEGKHRLGWVAVAALLGTIAIGIGWLLGARR